MSSFLYLSQDLFKRGQARLNIMRRNHMPLQCLLGLQSIAGYTDHRGPFPLDLACLDELPCACQGDTACCLGKDAFCPGKQFDGVDDLLVRDILA